MVRGCGTHLLGIIVKAVAFYTYVSLHDRANVHSMSVVGKNWGPPNRELEGATVVENARPF